MVFSKLWSRVSIAENALLEVMPGLVVLYALLLKAQPVIESRFGIFIALGGPFSVDGLLLLHKVTGRVSVLGHFFDDHGLSLPDLVTVKL